MKISIVGTGYVGLVSGACFADQRHQVICVDLDEARIDAINRGKAPFHEKGLDELLETHAGKNLAGSTDLRQALLDSEMTFVAVGTPFDGSHIDLGAIKAACRQIGEALREKPDYHTVIIKSTVIPGTTDNVVRGILEDASGKQAGTDFGLGMNPEFLTEGTAVDDFQYPDRIVLGGIDQRTIDLQKEAYAGFPDTPVIETNNTTAEMIKYASNAVLATLISFSNEIANLCTAIGDIDVVDVMEGVHKARYFTSRLADGRSVTAPITSFLYAGCGFGGSCLPKDVSALVAQGRDLGLPMELLDSVLRINRRQPGKLIELLESHFGDLADKRVTVLGLAFKPDTDDLRETPAVPVIRMLLERNALVKAYDPVVSTVQASAARLGFDSVQYSPSLTSAIEGSDAAVIVTRWDEFTDLPALVKKLPNPPVIVDGRRIIPPALVPEYLGIGLAPE